MLVTFHVEGDAVMVTKKVDRFSSTTKLATQEDRDQWPELYEMQVGDALIGPPDEPSEEPAAEEPAAPEPAPEPPPNKRKRKSAE